MRFRKLRIAWSVAWASVAVLTFACWMRSLWWIDSVTCYYAPWEAINVYSVEGRLAIEKRGYSSADLWSHIATRFDGPQTHYDDYGRRVSNIWFQVMRYSSFN